MLRIGEKGFDRGPLNHFTGIHDTHHVTNARNDTQVMADIHDRGVKLTAQFADQIKHGRFDCDIERRSRLVHNQQGWVVEQRHCDHDALLLSTRNLVGVTLDDTGRIRHVHQIEHFDAPFQRHCVVNALVNG